MLHRLFQLVFRAMQPEPVQHQITNALSRPMAVTGTTIAPSMSQDPSVSIHPQAPESDDPGTCHDHL
jgi:hypothetical protein